MKDTLRWLIYPGVNLHARIRYARVPRHFAPRAGSDSTFLDAGCGNGMLSWKAYKAGNRVVGVTLKDKEVRGCRRLFNEYHGVPESRLSFRNHNLYDSQPLIDEFGGFDEIVCTEVLEHIRDDSGVCKAFWTLLKPGGRLHITSPNAEHPYNVAFPIDHEEKGGHVRPGYTMETYRELLEPIGFRLECTEGLGGPVRQAFNARIKSVQERFGAAAGLPLFFLSLPFLPFDPKHPRVPFSLYAMAVKPADAG